MFIKNLTISNYKCFQEKIEVEFYRRNIIAVVGKNSSGKTSLLEFIFNNSQIVEFDSRPSYIVYCNFSENNYQLLNTSTIFTSNNVVNNFFDYGKKFEDLLLTIDLDPINLKYEYDFFTSNYHFKRGNLKIDSINFSSGEKKFINLMLLLKNFENYNTLFLLDEPDAFINSSLKRRYINFFENALKDRNSQVIFTTHSCDLLADLQENQIYLCSNGKIENIDFNPFGLSKEVIKKKLFKVEYGVSEKVEKEFKKINNKIKNIEQSTELYNNNVIIELENQISKLFADSPIKDELFKKLNNLKRG